MKTIETLFTLSAMDKIWWKYFVCASSIISSASGHSNGSIYCHIIISFVFLLRINFYCCIVTSQCCVGLYCSATWIRHTHIYPPFWVHPLRTPRCSKQNSVPYTAVSHQLSTLYILSIVYMSIPISQFIPPLPFPLGVHIFDCYICVSLLCK